MNILKTLMCLLVCAAGGWCGSLTAAEWVRNPVFSEITDGALKFWSIGEAREPAEKAITEHGVRNKKGVTISWGKQDGTPCLILAGQGTENDYALVLSAPLKL